MGSHRGPLQSSNSPSLAQTPRVNFKSIWRRNALLATSKGRKPARLEPSATRALRLNECVPRKSGQRSVKLKNGESGSVLELQACARRAVVPVMASFSGTDALRVDVLRSATPPPRTAGSRRNRGSPGPMLILTATGAFQMVWDLISWVPRCLSAAAKTGTASPITRAAIPIALERLDKNGTVETHIAEVFAPKVGRGSPSPPNFAIALASTLTAILATKYRFLRAGKRRRVKYPFCCNWSGQKLARDGRHAMPAIGPLMRPKRTCRTFRPTSESDP
jgi:hypothetical protein